MHPRLEEYLDAYEEALHPVCDSLRKQTRDELERHLIGQIEDLMLRDLMGLADAVKAVCPSLSDARAAALRRRTYLLLPTWKLYNSDFSQLTLNLMCLAWLLVVARAFFPGAIPWTALQVMLGLCVAVSTVTYGWRMGPLVAAYFPHLGIRKMLLMSLKVGERHAKAGYRFAAMFIVNGFVYPAIFVKILASPAPETYPPRPDVPIVGNIPMVLLISKPSELYLYAVGLLLVVALIVVPGVLACRFESPPEVVE